MRLWPVGGWVSLVWGNLAQSAYPPPGGGVWVGGWVGGRMVRQPLLVHENTIFTERTWLKVAQNSGLLAEGLEPALCMLWNAAIYH